MAMWRRLVMTAAVAALTLGWPTMAGAATGWVVQPTPAMPGGAGFLGVSCPSADSCTAVGSRTDSSGTVLALAEHWNGSTWAIQATPNPAGTGFSTLNGVSCTSATDCTAVGRYRTNAAPGTDLALAEHWNGSTWAVQATPDPAGSADTILAGVSCAAAASCTAVGDYISSSGTQLTLGEQWNGSAWAIEATPSPAGPFSELTGVSCTSVTQCIAIGFTLGIPHHGMLAELWNGSQWSAQSTNVARGGALSAISCPAATRCTAVGVGTNGTLAVSWNGATWTRQAMPHPASLQQSVLNSVSCVSTGCTAVGQFTQGVNTDVALAEHFGHGTWRVQATASPASDKDLSGVSCTAAGGCIAAGSATGKKDQTLVEHR